MTGIFRCDDRECPPSDFFCSDAGNCISCSTLCTHCGEPNYRSQLCPLECPGFLERHFGDEGTTAAGDYLTTSKDTTPFPPTTTTSQLHDVMTNSPVDADFNVREPVAILTIGIFVGMLLGFALSPLLKKCWIKIKRWTQKETDPPAAEKVVLLADHGTNTESAHVRMDQSTGFSLLHGNVDDTTGKDSADQNEGFSKARDTNPVDTPPVDKIPVDMTSVDMTPVDLTPVDMTPVDLTPVDMTQVDMTSVDVTALDTTAVQWRKAPSEQRNITVNRALREEPSPGLRTVVGAGRGGRQDKDSGKQHMGTGSQEMDTDRRGVDNGRHHMGTGRQDIGTDRRGAYNGRRDMGTGKQEMGIDRRGVDNGMGSGSNDVGTQDDFNSGTGNICAACYRLNPKKIPGKPQSLSSDTFLLSQPLRSTDCYPPSTSSNTPQGPQEHDEQRSKYGISEEGSRSQVQLGSKYPVPAERGTESRCEKVVPSYHHADLTTNGPGGNIAVYIDRTEQVSTQLSSGTPYGTEEKGSIQKKPELAVNSLQKLCPSVPPFSNQPVYTDPNNQVTPQPVSGTPYGTEEKTSIQKKAGLAVNSLQKLYPSGYVHPFADCDRNCSKTHPNDSA